MDFSQITLVYSNNSATSKSYKTTRLDLCGLKWQSQLITFCSKKDVITETFIYFYKANYWSKMCQIQPVQTTEFPVLHWC